MMIMLEMFKPKSGSPITKLATNITDTQTTIEVVDASYLGDAPNIAVIGTGVNAETIRYEEISGNTLTGVTRGFQGAAKSWEAGTNIARYFTAYDLESVQENIKELQNQQPEYSTPVTETSSVIPLPATTVKGQAKVGLKGRTTINLLGNAGDCEDVSLFYIGRATASLDNSNKIFGSNSIKITADNTFGAHYIRLGDTAYPIAVDEGKYLLVSAYLKPNSGKGCISARCRDITNSTYTGSTTYSSIIESGNFERVGVKLLTDPGTGFIFVNLLVLDSEGNMEHTGSGENMNVDGISIVEITEDEYNLTVEELLAKYPFHNGIKSSFEDEWENLHSVGKNACPTNEKYWEYGTYNIATGEKLFSTVTNRIRLIQDIEVVPNAEMTFSTSSGYRHGIMEFDKDGNFINDPTDVWSATNVTTFTTSATTAIIAIVISKNDDSSLSPSDISIIKPQLEYGNTNTAFVDYIGSSKTYPPALRSLPNGVSDEITESGKLLRRTYKVNLDGSLNWVFNNDYTGYKRVAITDWNTIFPQQIDGENTQLLVTSEGEVLQYDSDPQSAPNLFKLSASSNALFITIDDADSGWSESYTPTQQDIKDYFNSNPYTLIYQLAKPDEGIITPLTVYESGTITVNSTVLPEITWSVPINRAAQMDSNTDAINQLSKDVANIWDSLLPLADKELAMAAISEITTDMSADTNDNELKNKINEILNIWA